MSNPWEATELFGKMLGEYTDNGYRMGTLDERERIIALLEARLNDLESCLKDDDCKTLAHIVSTCIDDIEGESNGKASAT
jgi:hypothetical protein